MVKDFERANRTVSEVVSDVMMSSSSKPLLDLLSIILVLARKFCSWSDFSAGNS